MHLKMFSNHEAFGALFAFEWFRVRHLIRSASYDVEWLICVHGGDIVALFDILLLATIEGCPIYSMDIENVELQGLIQIKG